MAGTSSTKGSITPAWWIRWVSSFDIIKVRICQLQHASCYVSQIYFCFAGSPHRTQSWIGALDKAGISNIWHGTEARNPYLHALFLFCKHFPQFFILGITWRASAYLVGLPSPFRLVSPLYIEKSTFFKCWNLMIHSAVCDTLDGPWTWWRRSFPPLSRTS